MPLSASALFHFTDTFEKLINIFKTAFRPQYCLEDWYEIYPDLRGRLYMSAVPMVCFCDIPLSQIGEHIKDYGSYAIGLSKNWATQNKLNPVIYTTPGSTLSNYIMSIIMDTNKIISTPSDIGIKTVNSFFEIMSFVKAYKGIHYRNGNKIREKVFYDEKEWRYVPSLIDQSEIPSRLDSDKFNDDNYRNKANEELASRIKLDFEPKDIKYILIPNEGEILELVKQIEEIKGPKYTYNEVKKLTTRVLTVDQVCNDI